MVVQYHLVLNSVVQYSTVPGTIIGIGTELGRYRYGSFFFENKITYLSVCPKALCQQSAEKRTQHTKHGRHYRRLPYQLHGSKE